MHKERILLKRFFYFFVVYKRENMHAFGEKGVVSKRIAFQVSEQKWTYLLKILKIQNAEKSRHSIRYGFSPRVT